MKRSIKIFIALTTIIFLLSLATSLKLTGKNEVTAVECGWSCNPGPSVSCKGGGDGWFTGYCSNGSRGACHEYCVGSINGSVQCGGQTFWISCPTFTKKTEGCCGSQPPPPPPKPTPTPIPPRLIQLLAEPTSQRKKYHLFLEARRGTFPIKDYYIVWRDQGKWRVHDHHTSKTNYNFYNTFSAYKKYLIKARVRDTHNIWSNRKEITINITPPTPTPTPTLTPMPTSTPTPNPTPTPSPQPTPTPTPTPIPIPQWLIIDGESYSSNGFRYAQIKNQTTNSLIGYNRPLAQTKSVDDGTYDVNSYLNYLFNSPQLSYSFLEKNLPADIKLKNHSNFDINQLLTAVNISQTNQGVIRVIGNLIINRSSNQLHRFIILVDGQTTITTNLKDNQRVIILSQKKIIIQPSVNQLSGFFFSQKDIICQTNQLIAKGYFIARNNFQLQGNQSHYSFQPYPVVFYDLITSPAFHRRAFHIFYFHETQPLF